MPDITDALKFDADGLIPAIAQDAATGEILMVAWMNAESLQRTLETGEAHYWSRSRKKLWHKGEESGNVQKVREIRDRLRQGRAAPEDRAGRRRRLPHRLPLLLLVGPEGRRVVGRGREGLQSGGEVREEVMREVGGLSHERGLVRRRPVLYERTSHQWQCQTRSLSKRGLLRRVRSPNGAASVKNAGIL